MMYESFVKAMKAYFSDLEVSEIKALSADERVELSQMLNDAGYAHPQYTPKTA